MSADVQADAGSIMDASAQDGNPSEVNEDGGIDAWTGDWRRYPYEAGELTFPYDEGHHPAMTSEWWYVNVHLDDPSGIETAFFVTFGESTVQLGAIYETGSDINRNGVKVGSSQVTRGMLDVSFTDGTTPVNSLVQVDKEPFFYDMVYTNGLFEFKLRLESIKPPHALGGSGLVQQLENTWTYYYCQPRLEVSGTMKRNQDVTDVKGVAWIDRQFYPDQEPEEYEGHIWLSIHLDDGTDIAAYEVTAADGTKPFPLMDVIGWSGEFQNYDDFEVEILEEFTSNRCRVDFPLRLRLKNEITGTDLELTSLMSDPTVNAGLLGCFMEGPFSVSGMHGNREVRGASFVEVIYGNAGRRKQQHVHH